MRQLTLQILMAALLCGAPSLAQPTEPAVQRGLSRKTAESRANQIRNPKYELSIRIEAGKEVFRGEVIATFSVVDKKRDALLDFAGGKILGSQINGAKTKLFYDGTKITIPKQKLTEGRNRIAIEFERAFSRTGSGFYRFVDPEDKSEYVYTDFEPFDANAMFPCFDQPDLKATYQLTAKVPKDWTVISYAREQSSREIDDKTREWIFPESLLFSTYVFSLHAGPFQQWEDRQAKVPSRLFARKSLAKYVKSEEWFTPTRQGFSFYEDYFATPYPFAKYDQVIVPDFNSGAMENVAAVTFSERYVSRGTETDEEREDRAEVILHEMAHMWFGNLVTMKWWDDLWLNESFATYMASKSMHAATEFKTAWRTFYQDMKQWAYWEDQLVTTHPILAQVGNTDDAFTNFDGITYGKGASVLKQVDFLLGREAFRDGVRSYLKEHAFQNATLIDFTKSLSEASKTNLDHWTRDWLKFPGVNTVAARYQCDGKGRIESFSLVQTAPAEHPELRTHKTQIATFGKDANGKIVERRSVAVNYTGSETPIEALVTEECPVFVYPNHEDHDFVKVQLDPVSLGTAKTELANFVDPFLRTMIWQSLWDMVRDAELAATDYAEIALSQLGREQDPRIVLSVLNNLHGEHAGSSSVLSYLPRNAPAEILAADKLRKRLEEYANQKLKEAVPGSDLQRIWFDSLAKSTFTENGKRLLIDALEGKDIAKGLEIDQDQRWLLTKQICLLGDAHCADWIAKESTRDLSSRGKQSALGAEAAQPAIAIKKQWFAEVLKDKSKYNLAELRSVMWNLFPTTQRDLTKEFTQEFFAALPKIAKSREAKFIETFAGSLAPASCSAASVDQLGKFIRGAGAKLNPIALREIRISHQEDQRCVKAMAVSRNRRAS